MSKLIESDAGRVAATLLPGVTLDKPEAYLRAQLLPFQPPEM